MEIPKIDWRLFRQKLLEAARSAQGRNVITFLIFLAIATVFWLLLALNDETQRDYNVRLNIRNTPAELTLLTGNPIEISVSVRDKASTLLKWQLAGDHAMQLNYNDIPQVRNNMIVGPRMTASALRAMFGQSAVISSRPDSLTIPFTMRRPKIVSAKVLEGEIVAASKYIVSGRPYVITDTVRLYSANAIPSSLKALHTLPLNATGLKDSTIVEVELDVPAGMRAIPPKVEVMIPVEPLVSHSRDIEVEMQGVPHGLTVALFPPKVKVSYLVAMSSYNDEQGIRVIADYNRRNRKTSHIPLRLAGLTDGLRGVTLEVDSVEFYAQQ